MRRKYSIGRNKPRPNVVLACSRMMRRFEEVLSRVRGEYLEMPGMILRPEQVERLCGVDHALCRMVLDRLVEAGFLCVRVGGGYGRASADVQPR